MEFNIAGKEIANGKMPFIVAELSGNHDQNINKAKALIKVAAECQADAVKLQTYTPDCLTLPVKNNYFFKQSGLWKGYYLYDLYQRGMTPWEWLPELKNYAHSLGLLFFSTPFDQKGVDFLEKQINPPLYKVASYELTHLPLLKYIGACKKPVVLSTGMATEEEIRKAMDTLKNAGSSAIVLLKCISAYPADPAEFNLLSLQTLKEVFDCPVGISDHTLTNEICLGATALGAAFIEKHLVLNRADNSIDSGFALEPDGFRAMIRSVRYLYKGMGKNCIGPTQQEALELTQRRSIFTADRIMPGEILSEKNLKIVRPSAGLSPSLWETVLGKKATKELLPGQPLKEQDWV